MKAGLHIDTHYVCLECAGDTNKFSGLEFVVIFQIHNIVCHKNVSSHFVHARLAYQAFSQSRNYAELQISCRLAM